VPANVRLMRWAPQLEVLARTSVMVNHAGFGTVKECILMGVPMVVFPLLQGRDHVACAEHVTYHGLGLRGDIEQITPERLISLIEEVLKQPAFRQRVAQMGEQFRKQDRLDIGVEVIESLMQISAKRAGQRLSG